MRGGIWKGDILVADVEELEMLDASESHPRRLNATEVLTPTRSDFFIFPIPDGNCLEEIMESDNPLQGRNNL